LCGKRVNAHGSHTWGVVGGHVEWAESFVETAIRETKEETGLTVKDVRLIAVTNDYFAIEDTHFVTIHLTCTYDEGEPANLDHEITDNWQWFPLTNLPEPLFLPLLHLQQGGFDFTSLIQPTP
ncbi:MAG TPA: NUDIX domain-containing protein, partial [Verrucomicrobiae bacterium]|nr:NUDIX domain-containing protein [Verrucomicrobiae bacterium]